MTVSSFSLPCSRVRCPRDSEYLTVHMLHSVSLCLYLPWYVIIAGVLGRWRGIVTIAIVLTVKKSISISAEMRFQKSTSVLASNVFLISGESDKILQVWFFVIWSTSSRSAYWNFVFMFKASNTMRSGFTTFSVLLGNRLAYFISKSSYGIRSAILIQRLSGFI